MTHDDSTYELKLEERELERLRRLIRWKSEELVKLKAREAVQVTRVVNMREGKLV